MLKIILAVSISLLTVVSITVLFVHVAIFLGYNMNIKKIIEKNISSSNKYGWTPGWFGHGDFDELLVKLIIEFQHDHSLDEDGIVGPMTYRRLETKSLADSDFKPSRRNRRKGEKGIMYNGIKYPIKWDKIILWDERGGLKANKGTYYDWSNKPLRKPVQFVNHWDATLSSEACARIINKRGLSMHFLIDNDGTIYQMLDMQHPAWQAGSKFWNVNGVGVEISNAFYTKYQSWYVKNGFGERPIVRSEVHGVDLKEHLDFYPVQLEALAALWEAVSNATGMELDVNLEKGVCEEAKKCSGPSFVNHYNLTSNKIDCASLDMEAVLEKAVYLTRLD